MSLGQPASPQRAVGILWGIIVVATLVRCIAAAHLPLSGDEAYYWEWSRRLAYGYYDHPPMVAWAIALFSAGHKSTLLVRMPFVISGLGAAICMHAFVARATSSAWAGASAALLLTLTPFAMIAFTTASPDGTYLLFWSLSLYVTLRALDTAPTFELPLAVSVAFAFLSRVLGGLLALGCAYVLAVSAAFTRPQRRRYDLLAILIFCALIAPYLVWDASHGWSAMRFAIYGRHDATYHGGNIISLLGLYALVLTPGVFIASIFALIHTARRSSPADRIVFATATPLLALCLLLALREPVEFYWADGAFISLIAAIGLRAHELLRGVRYALVVVPAAAIALLLYSVAAFPLQIYNFAQHSFGLQLRHEGPFEIWAFEPAARDMAREAASTHAWVMTDGYGLSSVLDYYGDIEPVVIGYDRQGREAREWATGVVPRAAFFFDKEALDTRPDFQARLGHACAVVKDEGRRSYYVNGILARTFYVTRCNGLTAAGFSYLRWADVQP